MKESYENMRLKEIREINKHIQVTTSKLLGVARGTYASWEIEQDIIPIKRSPHHSDLDPHSGGFWPLIKVSSFSYYHS